MDATAGEVLRQALALHKSQRYDDASRLYNALLNQNPFNEDLLFLLGDVYLRCEANGLAINLLTNLLQINPKNGEAWCNLGIGYRVENRIEEAIKCWERALAIQGDTSAVCSNMAGLYADRCDPEQALHWLDRTLAIEPESPEGHWQRALALLTLRNWELGWPEYEYRLKLEHFDTRQSLGLGYWDFTPTEHLYIHGEQGIGDEIMFLSCINDVLPLAKRVTLEVNSAVVEIAKATWPQINVINEPITGDYTAKTALGSLAAHFRRSEASFPGKAYLKPDRGLVERYRARLRELGPGPYLAIAWHGGTKKTRVVERSMTLPLLKPILERYTCVSGQYEHNNPYVQMDREEHGLVKLDDASSGKDMHAQAALFSAVDAVVTVQQTAVHVAGSVGTPAFVMVNKTPHWRYHKAGHMPWYRSVELIRQQTQGDWAPVVQQVEQRIAELSRQARAA